MVFAVSRLFASFRLHDGFRRQRKRLIVWVAIVLLLLPLTACSIDQFKTKTAKVPRIVISSLSDPKTFNYIFSEESSSSLILGYLYTGLLSTNGITGELEPGLAESWQISPDQKRIVYKLREGLKWSDGEPMTVDDIVFYYNDIVFNPKISSSNSDLFRIGPQGTFPIVRQVGDRQVEFISPEPFAPLLRFAGGTFLPKHALESYINSTGEDGKPKFLSQWGTDTDPSKIIGSGAYRIKSYQPGQRVILERNPHYWRKDNQGNPQPYVEQIVIQIIESEDASLAQFRSGELHVEGIPPESFALLKQEEKRGNFSIYEGGPALSSSFLVFNQNKASRNGKPLINPTKSRWFNSVPFRQAIAHAIDRPTMINSIYQGLGVPQNSPIYIQSPYYFPPEKGLPTYEYDPAKAKELLRGAGFRYNERNELLDDQGNRVRFTLVTNSGNQTREAMGSQIKRDLASIGIVVDFQPLAFNALISKMDNSLDWEAVLLGLGGAGIEPDGGRNVWSPDGRLHFFNQLPDESQGKLEGREIADWEKRVGQLYVQGGQELDDEKRKAIYAQAQELIQQYVPMIFLVNPLSMSAVRNQLEGVEYSALGGALWNVYELKLTED
ncbi:ABC transporter substrate-binding protein [Phormidium tenue FACHB-886]|nr:ABC transporter substrate-binding protein [Phormidium tenue FACHB-886]